MNIVSGSKRRVVGFHDIALVLFAFFWTAVAQTVGAQQVDIHGPPESVAFGTAVAVLPNGNIVVSDPSAGLQSQGAVHLYTTNGNLLRSFTGSTANDQIGSGGITVLASGNFVIASPNWTRGASTNAGAVTWVDGNTGLSGIVSPSNSLVGTTSGDKVGNRIVTALRNGNYVVASPNWVNGGTVAVGAVTWANGYTGMTGPVSPTNSLIGANYGDGIGSHGVVELSNGNYVVESLGWGDGVTGYLGAVTWVDGGMGTQGIVSAANSLIGTKEYEFFGDSVIALTNGNYVVDSYLWSNGTTTNVGAVTWANGNTGISGAVSVANSLVGTLFGDEVGREGVAALSNGNYVVASSFWGGMGAATWANGNTGLTGFVSSANSLTGTAGTVTGDRVGVGGITPLSNGNYVVDSPYWYNNGNSAAGAATWGNGSTGLVGSVSSANSLVGTSVNDYVGGSGVTALSNSNYVIASYNWHYGTKANAGAATWGDGTIGQTGPVSISNSLVGTTGGDQIGSEVIALTNGNYVITSYWSNGGSAGVGSATWANGTTGLSGVVSPINSLVGSTANDGVGSWVTALSNGNYVVASQDWTNGMAASAGAATWADGRTGVSGFVSPANSLVGTIAGDYVSSNGIMAFANGNYVVASHSWNNGAIANVGAVSLGRGNGGLTGPIVASNSVRGNVAGAGINNGFAFDYDNVRDQLVVGQTASNVVSLFKADRLFANGFE